MFAELTTSHARLATDVNQIGDSIACLTQIQQILTQMNSRLHMLSATIWTTTLLEDNHREKPNFRNQRNLSPQNINRDFGVKIVIPKYVGKIQLDTSMVSLVCVENVFAHNPITYGCKVTPRSHSFQNRNHIANRSYP